MSQEEELQATCSLYVWHEGETRFIATLSGQDNVRVAPVFAKPPEFHIIQQLDIANDWINVLWERTVRVSPDGHRVVFMSDRSLTGYDNTVSSGDSCGLNRRQEPLSARCEEVFRYDAGSERLTCVSCDPSGARPAGPSAISPGTRIGSGVGQYVSHLLSDSGGRMFFDSADALVPGDTNGTVDVYQWEEAGEGDCRREAGCVSLISLGKGSAESKFVDASADGSDVFFITRDRLVNSDFDNAYDVYDAHVCGAHGVECLAVAPVSPPPCSSGDGCRPSPSPQPAVFGAPASATFSGAGNLTQSTSGAAAKPKAKRKGKPRPKSRAKSEGKKRHARHAQRARSARGSNRARKGK